MNKYNDLEIWVDIEDYEGIYQVSNHGRVRTLDRMASNGYPRLIKGKILKPFCNSDGYHKRLLTNSNGRKGGNIHRIVAKNFVNNPTPKVNNIINHKDGDKMNNHHSNLEWCTHLHNVRHAIHNNFRDRCHSQVLTKSDVRKIRQMYDETNNNYSEIARLYNVTANTIMAAIKYITFTNVDVDIKNNYKIFKLKGEERKNWLNDKIKNRGGKSKPIESVLNEEEVFEITSEYTNTNIKIKPLVKKYGVSKKMFIKYYKSLKKVPLIKFPNEIFKKFDNKYAISNMGRVFNLKMKRLSFNPPNKIKNKKLKNVIAELFLPNPSGLTNVKTIDGSDNYQVSNLKWGHGEYFYTPKDLEFPSEEQTQFNNRIIEQWKNTNKTQSDLRKEFNVGKDYILLLLKGMKKNFTHSPTMVTKDEAYQIRQKYIHKISKVKDIENEYNLSKSYVYKILNSEYGLMKNTHH